jgi:hypothetical protein
MSITFIVAGCSYAGKTFYIAMNPPYKGSLG